MARGVTVAFSFPRLGTAASATPLGSPPRAPPTPHPDARRGPAVGIHTLRAAAVRPCQNDATDCSHCPTVTGGDGAGVRGNGEVCGTRSRHVRELPIRSISRPLLHETPPNDNEKKTQSILGNPTNLMNPRKSAVGVQEVLELETLKI